MTQHAHHPFAVRSTAAESLRWLGGLAQIKAPAPDTQQMTAISGRYGWELIDDD
jgi:hypothetical protein